MNEPSKAGGARAARVPAAFSGGRGVLEARQAIGKFVSPTFHA